MGFSMLSPRFERFNNKYAPGPGEYHTEDLEDQKLNLKGSPHKLSKSKYLFRSAYLTSNNLLNLNIGSKKTSKIKKSTNKIKAPHSYIGHDTLVKKSFNKLLHAKDES